MKYFFPVIKKGNKRYIEFSKEDYYISDKKFEELRQKRYIIYIETLEEYFFILPEGKESPIENIPKESNHNKYEDEYISFDLETQRRNHTIQYRERLSLAIANDINFVPCDLDQLLYDTKVIAGKEKNSGSNTAVAFGRLKIGELWKNKKESSIIAKTKEEWYKDDQVVLKISFSSKNLKEDNSLIVENVIYENIILKMITKDFTPHVMIPLFSYNCKKFDMKNVKSKAMAPFVKWAKKVDPKDYDKSSLNILILEKGKGKTLNEWMSTKHESLSWLTILFQITWTLNVFNEYGLNHNDLHADNIFIDPLEYPIYGIYFLTETTYFILPINYFVKIYDFDRASVNPNKKNKTLLKLIKEQYLQKSYNTKIYKPKTKSQKRFSKLDAEFMETNKFTSTFRKYDISLDTSENVIKGSNIENTALNSEFCYVDGQCNEFSAFGDLYYVLWEIYNKNSWKKSIIPKDIKKFVLDIFYGKDDLLEKENAWRGILCETNEDKSGQKEEKLVCEGPYPIDPKKDMKLPRHIIETMFPTFKKQLPYFDPSYTIDNDYPHLYILPSLQIKYPKFFDRVETSKITKPIRFSQLKF
jgi:hypothetical protein